MTTTTVAGTYVPDDVPRGSVELKPISGTNQELARSDNANPGLPER